MNADRDGSGPQALLIAEDDGDLVATIQEFAEALGLRAVVAEDGERAVELYGAYSPVVCFLDILLPKMSGFEACRAIKDAGGRSAPPVIMMSGVISDASMVAGEMKESGADDFVTKPFPLVRLCEVIALRVPALAKAAMRLHLERTGGAPDPAPPSSKPSRPASRQKSDAPAVPQRVEPPVPSGPSRLADRRAQRARSTPETSRSGPVRTQKILVVEDSADLRAIYADFAKRLGLDVIEAATGPSALEIFAQQAPDLCLVDLLLPGKNGMEVCREIKAASPDTIVVAMSAVYRNMDSLTKDLERYGADDYIHKPFGMAALRDLLEQRLPPGTLTREGDGLRLNVDASARDVGGHLSSAILADGSLATVGFAALIFKARAKQFTGSLQIDRDGVIRTIEFASGIPVGAASTSSEEGLDAVLVRQGHIKLEALNEIVLHEDYIGELAADLLRENLIPHRVLEQASQDTVREVLLSCFRLDGGQYEFFPGDVARHGVEVSTNPIALIREGVLKALSQNQIAQRLGDMVQHYVLRTPWFERFRADFPTQGREPDFLEAIDGDATLSQLMGRRILEMNQTLGVIWALYQARMIVFSEQRGDEYSISDLAPPAPIAAPVAKTAAPDGPGGGPKAPRPEESLSLWSQLFGASGAEF